MESTASFWEAVRGAAASLRSSKLRSFLTLLGIILATTTLIAVMAVINGMNRYIAENVSNMGADGFRVRRMVMIGAFDPKKYLEMQRRNPELKREEFDFLKSHATLIGDIGMETQRQAVVHYGIEQVDGVGVQGVTSNMAALTNTQIALGRFLSEGEDQRRQMVAFVGNDIKQRFFPSVNPIGKVLSIEGRPSRAISKFTAGERESVIAREPWITITFFARRMRRGCCCAPIAICGPIKRTPSPSSPRTRWFPPGTISRDPSPPPPLPWFRFSWWLAVSW
jgi:hypothetical protein